MVYHSWLLIWQNKENKYKSRPDSLVSFLAC
jgi:hypothetical protein